MAASDELLAQQHEEEAYHQAALAAAMPGEGQGEDEEGELHHGQPQGMDVDHAPPPQMQQPSLPEAYQQHHQHTMVGGGGSSGFVHVGGKRRRDPRAALEQAPSARPDQDAPAEEPRPEEHAPPVQEHRGAPADHDEWHDG